MEREIQHRFHEHPLMLVEKQSGEGEKAYCSGCGDAVSAPCFSCALCNYHLHDKCASAPYSISSHPLHPRHSGLFLRQSPSSSRRVYGCALCKQKRNMFFYECNNCWFSLDIKCADLSSSYSKVSPECNHPLSLIQSPMDEHKSLHCSCCHEPLVGPLYVCVGCPFIFHNTCIDGSTKLTHPSHRIHPLLLESNERSLFCKVCQKEHDGFFYSCSVCDFKMNIVCAWPNPIVEDKSRHQHPFTLLRRQGSFVCDACGTEGNYVSYICSTCNIVVHKDCTKLPRIIKFSRHDHCLFHKYFLETQELTRQDSCKVCFNEVKLERGSYSCVKPGCSYVVHVKCALEDERFYSIVKEESQCEELYGAKSMQSSIDRVLEVNKDGEATKIKHFIHQHCLVLADKIVEETDRKCDGCMLPVSTPFYYCSESDCHFCLHKNCAELPRIKHHWFRRYTATLSSKRFKYCDLCRRYCSGFFYETELLDICLRCAEVADIIEFPGHEHLLFYDFKCLKRCNGCGKSQSGYGAFRCGKCSFVLDFACLSLPHSVLHKSDQHMLNLTYDDDNDYSKHCYCDICEGKRDQNLWYYSCSICDTCAHPDCVLGQYPFLKDGITFPMHNHHPGVVFVKKAEGLFPFLKDGITFPMHNHHHGLLFFKKAEGYPECSDCGKLCQEEILKCAEPTCDYIIHCKCLDTQK